MSQMQTFTRPDGSSVTHEVIGDWTKLVSPEALNSIDKTIAAIAIRNRISPLQHRRMKKENDRRVKEKETRQRRKNIISDTVRPKNKNEIPRGIAPVTPPKTTKQRPCMTCTKSFDSEGAHNRLCAHCRHLTDC